MNKLFIFITLIFVTTQAYAKTVSIAFSQFKTPYIIEDSKKGLEIDLFRAALEHKGHRLNVVHFPHYRILTLNPLKRDNIDGISNIKKKDARYHYVKDFLYYEDVVVSKKKNNLKIDSLADLKGLSIMAWPSAYKYMGDVYFNLFKPEPKLDYKKKYKETPNRFHQNRLFWLDKVEVVILDKTIFLWYRKLLSDKFPTTDDFVIHPVINKKTFFNAAFKDKQLADDFAEGIEYLKKTGKYEEIYNKYRNN